MIQPLENPPAPVSLDEAVEDQRPKDIDNSQASSIGTDKIIDKIRGNLATRLIGLVIGVNIGIGILVAIDLFASKWLVLKTIEHVAAHSKQGSKSPEVGQGNSEPPPKAAEIAIVYKDLLKESALSKDLLTLLLTSQTALVSGALGFYFGGKDNNK